MIFLKIPRVVELQGYNFNWSTIRQSPKDTDLASPVAISSILNKKYLLQQSLIFVFCVAKTDNLDFPRFFPTVYASMFIFAQNFTRGLGSSDGAFLEQLQRTRDIDVPLHIIN